MNKLMQILSEAEKSKVLNEQISLILRHVSEISIQSQMVNAQNGHQSISNLLNVASDILSTDIYGNLAGSIEYFSGGLKGKRVLDVGCDSSGKLINAIAKLGAYEAIGVNPAVPPNTFGNYCRIEGSDIRATAFPDNYFDCIVSISAFEHIHDLRKALGEMFRILKPGGTLFTRFGPVWSSSFGHHMWFTHQGTVYNYWNTFLPPFCHLLMTPNELFAFCKPLYGDDAASKIVEYIFFTQEQNRLLFSDYRNLVAQSNFETLFFTGYTDTVLSRLYVPTDWPNTLETLHARYPHNDNFKYDGIELLLKKPYLQQ